MEKIKKFGLRVVLCLVLAPAMVYGMHEKKQETGFLDKVPGWCTKIATELNSQKPVLGNCSRKTLPKRQSECGLFRLMSREAKKFNNGAWDIFTYQQKSTLPDKV